MRSLLYVDDEAVTYADEKQRHWYEHQLKQRWKVTCDGVLDSYVGFQIEQRDDHTILHQTGYVKDVLERFKVDTSKTETSPFAENFKGLTGAVDDEPVHNLRLYQEKCGALLYCVRTYPCGLGICYELSV